MQRTPLLVVGDGPQEPTGLGRIARDLVGLITQSDLPVDLVQLGGSVPPPWTAWRHFPLDRDDEWGAPCTQRFWQDLFGKRPGILWVIWDPGRLYPYAAIEMPVQRWAYTAIDAENVRGEVGGPARTALQHFDRVIGYGRWASQVLQRTIGRPVPYLPHGITSSTFTIPPTPEESLWVDETLGPFCGREATLIGCVATNQARKDLAMFVQTLAELRERGLNVYGWLQTDRLVSPAWSIQELVESFSLLKSVTVTTPPMTDRQLALLYQRCDVTIAPGLGEGFGYPIVESLAAGTPVIHGDYAGGAELIPKTEWRVPVRAERLDGVYALKRPVFSAGDWANAVERALSWRETMSAPAAAAYCRGAVAHLEWSAIWPRWYRWIRDGLA